MTRKKPTLQGIPGAGPPPTAGPVPVRAARGTAQVGLASWLGGGSVFIVLLAVAAIAIACAILLSRLVEQQGLVRAQLAVASLLAILALVTLVVKSVLESRFNDALPGKSRGH